MELKLDYSDISFRQDGRLKLLIIVGTRPEIIRLSEVIRKCRRYFDCLLAHTGQNYDYNLNGVFFRDLELEPPEVYMDAVGDDLGATVGNIINCSYKLMVQTRPDALLILGDTNSCLSAIPAKRLHIPIFHMLLPKSYLRVPFWIEFYQFQVPRKALPSYGCGLCILSPLSYMYLTLNFS